MQDLFSESFRQMLDKHCTARHVREIEAGAAVRELWGILEESGFPNAMLPESHDGAGLRLRDVFPLILAAGEYALPVPLAHTMVLRAVRVAEGASPPDGCATLACQAEQMDDGEIRCSAVPYGAVADWVVADLGDYALLLDVNHASRIPTGVHGSLEADLVWPATVQHVRLGARSDWLAIGAAVQAAQMAGAMERVLRSTLTYANERSQFGKAIGKFQAIQQQMSVMAEEAFASRMAAEMGCASTSSAPDSTLAAVAKARCSEAAWTVASIAHAVHGAMGITEEYDLQLHTRRLHEWRLSYGSESYWNLQLGRALIGSTHVGTVEFIRQSLFLWEDPERDDRTLFEQVQ